MLWMIILPVLFAIAKSSETCEAIRVQYCTSVGYNFTSYPTMNGIEDQEEASQQLSDFMSHIQVGCSNATLLFLCSYYVPFCFRTFDDKLITLQPCRNLCMQVYSDCYKFFLNKGFSWPEHLECSKFEPHRNGTCFGPNDPSTVNFTIDRIHSTSTDISTDIETTITASTTVTLTSSTSASISTLLHSDMTLSWIASTEILQSDILVGYISTFVISTSSLHINDFSSVTQTYNTPLMPRPSVISSSSLLAPNTQTSDQSNICALSYSIITILCSIISLVLIH